MTSDAPTAAVAQFRLPILAFALGCLLHLGSAPPWCLALALVATAWRLLPGGATRRLPSRSLRLALTLALVVVLFVTSRYAGGLAFGTALLMAMGAAKIAETRARRDGYTLTVVALFLLLAAILDRQDLARVPFYAAVAWVGCAALAALGGQREAESTRAALATSGRALAWALPLAIFAFLFFPRVQGGLWGMPGSGRAQTGLSDEMSPGSISELSISDAVAFRVVFDGEPPAAELRYWRGPVLHWFDGYTWRRAPSPAPAEPLERIGPAYAYRITLEPHGHPWWYALDTIDASPSRRVALTYDGQLTTFEPVTSVVSYAATSHVATRSTANLSSIARRQDTQFPAQRNPRSIALARELGAAQPSTRALIRAVLERFRADGLRYTMTPEKLDPDSVDDFLFNTRAGFCGHFASAFVLLMRAAGVPARVVTGYQGGEWNALGGYFIVRQSDAHAWAEVWIDGEGWQRVDPTAVAAPERLSRGLRDLLPDSGDLAARLVRNNRWLGELLRTWDAANTWWRRRVVEFDQQAQLSLLQKLGLPDADYRAMAALLLGAAALWAAVLAWRQRRFGRPGRRDPLALQWARLKRALAAAGVPLGDAIPPGALIAAASAQLPELAPALHEALDAYLAARYGRDAAAGFAARLPRLEARLARHRRERRWPLLGDAERAALERLLPWIDEIPPPLRARTERLARRFLDTVPLVGCNGFVVDAAARAMIAFPACLLVATRDLSLYRSLRSVLVYPDEFVVRETHVDEAGVVTEGERPLSGQTEDDTRVLISWADVREGLEAGDGYNVVLHEFAHFLDHVSDGALSGAGGGQWRATFDAEFDALCAAVDAGEETLIDPYGAEDEAEFFAVCTEVFFELPVQLRARHGALYDALARFYGLDPAGWVGSDRGGGALRIDVAHA